jgi:polysaccharide biosynthesis/export protein
MFFRDKKHAYLTIILNMKRNLYLISTILFFSTLMSCIPNKKIAYLQYKNEYREPGTIVKDSLIRKYTNGEIVYRLQSSDLLDIKISTMTPTAFNPFIDADRNLVPGQVYNQQITQAGSQVQPQGYPVSRDGFIELPMVGRIMVAGLSIKQAEDTLASHVRKFLEKPVVRVKLLNYRFTVLGEVNNESTLLSGDASLTILQALGMAGGVSEFGDLSRIKVLRRSGDQTYVFYVNLLSEEFLSSPFYFVQPGDVFIVTPHKQRSYLKYMSNNLSVLTASASLLVAIVTLFRVR